VNRSVRFSRISARSLLGHALSLITSSAVPTLVFAQATNPFQTGAESLVTNFTAIATPFAVLAIMVLAVVAMTGRISWAWPVGALVGIGVIFGAPTIVTWVRGLFGV
jgi:type IV secretory pathway VirB2 component (pilin)